VLIRIRVTDLGSRHVELLIKLKQCVLLIELFERLRLGIGHHSPNGAIPWTITDSQQLTNQRRPLESREHTAVPAERRCNPATAQATYVSAWFLC
jgi:hypothetical protein